MTFKFSIPFFIFPLFLLSSCASNSDLDISQPAQSNNIQSESSQSTMMKIQPSTTVSVKDQEVKKPYNQTKAQTKRVNEVKEYRAVIGDSMYSISKKFGVSLVCLSRANNIDNPNKLAAGKLLVIPTKSECN